jgi:hypothetical protein
MVAKQSPAATAAAEPPEEPPATWLALHGLTTGPKWLSSEVVPTVMKALSFGFSASMRVEAVPCKFDGRQMPIASTRADVGY